MPDKKPAPDQKKGQQPDAPRDVKQPYAAENEDYLAHDVAEAGKPAPEGKRDFGRKQ